MAKPGRKNSRAAAAPPRRGRRTARWALWIFLLASLLATALWLTNQGNQPSKSKRNEKGSLTAAAEASSLEPEQTVFARYGGSASCQECHEEAYNLWKTSHHALAERTLRSEQDQAAFEPARRFQHGTQSSELRWTNGAAQVTTVGLSGKPETQTVARVIGNDPLRQFLVPFPGGRFQTLEASYDPHSNQWFNVYGGEDRRPGEWGHWTGRGMNWNYMCASCHNTRLRRNYDEPNDRYRTTMAEMSIGCEACHGPLKAHNEWQRQHGKSGQKDPTLTKATRAQVLDDCGGCHARRGDLTGDFKPGDKFLDNFDLTLVDHSENYYADGQVRGEDYEYGSFLGSRMHLRGVICLDCHNSHSTKTLLPGNYLCLRCHNGTVTNAPVINPSTHSHHKVRGFDTNGNPTKLDLTDYRPKEIAEKGGECVNCHMPQTVYMQRHSRHDHGFTIPDPLLTRQFGIPNACNRCHQDKDVDWAMKYCEEWYGAKMERPTRQRAQIIARAQRGETQASEQMVGWLKQEESPYWQAVLLGMLEPWAARPEVSAAMVQALKNTNALVRAAAARSLEPALANPNPAVADALQPLLQDPVRSVRVGAASSLRATVDPASLAGQDLQRYLDNNADEPSGQVQKAIYAFSRNDPRTALSHLQKAVAWDPYSPSIHQELAVIFSALNRPQEAVQVLKEACRLAPNDAESHYKLGLAYNEIGDLKGTAEQLAAVVRLDPRHALAWYNLGLAQNSLDQTEPALESLARAESADPEDARVPYARATILARLGKAKEAKAAARRALELAPGYAEANQLLQMLSQ